MAKLMSSFIVLLLLYNCIGQHTWEKWDTDGIKDLNMTCDYAECSSACEDAAAPPYCPNKLPDCSTGCVCMLQCKEPTITCFKIKHCQKKQWFLGRKKPLRT